MSSLLRFVPRSSLLLGLLATVALPPRAQADARPDFALELVRSIASQPAPPPSAAPAKPSAGKARKRFSRTRSARPDRGKRATTPTLRLTAAQRGSGRVQIVDAGDASPCPSALPAVERKPAGGFGPRLVAVRPR
jgi:hypothetical protein